MLYATELVIGSDRIVKVNNTFIKESDLEKEYEKRKKLPQMDSTPVTKMSVLQSLIDENLILDEIKNKHIEANEDEVNKTLNQYKMLYAQEMMQKDPNFKFDEVEYKAYIENEIKIPYDNFINKVKDSIRVKQYITDKAKGELADIQKKNYNTSDLKSFYYQHLKEFQVPLTVELKHIFLLTVTQDGKPIDKNEKKIIKDRMGDILKRLKKGESFDKLCKLNSQDEASRDYKDEDGNANVGYLGILAVTDESARQQFGDDTFYKLFDLNKGSYSGVLTSKVGYHIFYVIDKKDPYTMSFEESRPQIEKYLKLMEQDQILKVKYTDIVKRLRNKATITYYKNEYKPK